jgi:hypothetical protein
MRGLSPAPSAEKRRDHGGVNACAMDSRPRPIGSRKTLGLNATDRLDPDALAAARGILVRPLKTPRGVAPDDVHHLLEVDGSSFTAATVIRDGRARRDARVRGGSRCMTCCSRRLPTDSCPELPIPLPEAYRGSPFVAAALGGALGSFGSLFARFSVRSTPSRQAATPRARSSSPI